MLNLLSMLNISETITRYLGGDLSIFHAPVPSLPSLLLPHSSLLFDPLHLFRCTDYTWKRLALVVGGKHLEAIYIRVEAERDGQGEVRSCGYRSGSRVLSSSPPRRTLTYIMVLSTLRFVAGEINSAFTALPMSRESIMST